MDIKAKIEKYNELQDNLGRGADNMPIESEGRSEFIQTYKNAIAREERDLAEWMHVNYEEISKGENWDTQKSCKVDFDSLPEENKRVMLELSKRILSSN